jgi:alkylhydroperoxidase family enzyme
MPRVRYADPDLRIDPAAAPAAQVNQALGAILAHRPEMASALTDLSIAQAVHGTLGARLVELVRLRIAFHNQCRSCMAVRY